MAVAAEQEAVPRVEMKANQLESGNNSATLKEEDTSSSSLTSNAHDFFCKCQCACNYSARFSNCLCVSACTFMLPSAILLQQGNLPMGGCAFLLFLTSIAYHWTHNAKFRALDVLMVWLSGSLGMLQCIADIVFDGPNVWLWLALLGIALVAMIDSLPFFYTTINNLDIIALQWHVVLHLLCTASLLCLAFGEQDVIQPVTLLLSPWSASAVLAAALGVGIVPTIRFVRVMMCKAQAVWSDALTLDSNSLLHEKPILSVLPLGPDQRSTAVAMG
ncbi:hypothetical protein AB1Y20_021413 [Prymnesium parvum]|uniref:Glycerophosphocholine acyltransferase 1 n=1 Tax=Prymnesium parvum TaxID=97485 RepID=A0AB34JIM0_PRYPA